MNRVAVQWAFFLALAVIAIAYFFMPARAASPPGWSAELWATERGEELVAVAYSREAGDDEYVPALTVMCGNPLWLRYDPGPEADDAIDWTGQAATFEFGFGDQHLERELQYEAMDGNWTSVLTDTDELLAAIEAGSDVKILMPNGGLAENTFSLAGASPAIAEVRATCP